jgi:hypothetical protein
MTSPRSERGLDWFAFFLADVQTGWAPFVAAYLTSVAWTQFDIGRVLTIGTLVGLALQVPAGALVDRVPAKWLLAALAVAAISAGALGLALWPVFSAVVVAKVLHAMGSCLVGPAVAAIFAWSTRPGVVIAAQLLDGVSAATLGVLVPLIIADTTRGIGHFNLAQGAVGAAVGIGASLSTTGAGRATSRIWRAAAWSSCCSRGQPSRGCCSWSG